MTITYGVMGGQFLCKEFPSDLNQQTP